MASVVMAHIVVAYIVMAHIVMAYIVMAYIRMEVISDAPELNPIDEPISGCKKRICNPILLCISVHGYTHIY